MMFEKYSMTKGEIPIGAAFILTLLCINTCFSIVIKTEFNEKAIEI